MPLLRNSHLTRKYVQAHQNEAPACGERSVHPLRQAVQVHLYHERPPQKDSQSLAERKCMGQLTCAWSFVA